MRSPRRSRAPLLAALLCCVGIGGTVVGCGGSQPPSTGIDPARAVPASASIYAGAIVRPTGDLRTNARIAASAFTHQAGAFVNLPDVLQTPGSPPLSFKRDLAPWLGTQAGIFLAGPPAPGGNEGGWMLSFLQHSLSGTAVKFPFASAGAPAAPPPQGALVLDVTNAGAARSFLARQAASAGAHPTNYRGVAYQLSSGGLAFALVGHFAVVGTDPAVRATIDANGGASSLARASDYARLQALAPARAIAHVYVSAALGAAAPRAGGSASLFSLLAAGRAANISVLPAQSSIALDADTLSSPAVPPSGGLLAPGSEAARVLGELPADSFVAIGFGSAATALSDYARALRGLFSIGGTPGRPEAPSPGLSLKGLFAATLAPVEAMTAPTPQAKRDFQSWMGPGAVFASGTGLIDLKAAFVITSKNPASSRAAVAKLAAKLRGTGASVQAASIPGTDAAVTANLAGLPVAIEIADGRDARGQTKFVIGLAEASVAAVLNPSAPLAAASPYSAAGAQLGEGLQPSLIAQVPTLLTLLEGAGLAEDPSIAPAVSYLRSLAAVSGGGRSLGAGADRFRLVLGLRPH
jgi:hypothetical protein